jgi:dUTP pyrophosphatase
MQLKIKLLYPDSIIPIPAHCSDAGMDLYVHSVEEKSGYIIVGTGIAVQPEEGYYTKIYPRSSIYKKGLMLYNSVGIIDTSYRGELILVFYKTQCYMTAPKVGERLAQLIVEKTIPCSISIVEELDATDRGTGGFGSTGN